MRSQGKARRAAARSVGLPRSFRISWAGGWCARLFTELVRFAPTAQLYVEFRRIVSTERLESSMFENGGCMESGAFGYSLFSGIGLI